MLRGDPSEEAIVALSLSRLYQGGLKPMASGPVQTVVLHFVGNLDGAAVAAAQEALAALGQLACTRFHVQLAPGTTVKIPAMHGLAAFARDLGGNGHEIVCIDGRVRNALRRAPGFRALSARELRQAPLPTLRHVIIARREST